MKRQQWGALTVKGNDLQTPNKTADTGAGERRKLALLVIGLITLPSISSMLPVFSTRIREYFVINAEQYGSLMGMQSLGRMPGLLLIGPLVARLGVGRASEISLIGVGLTFLIVGLGGNLLAFQIGFVAMGFFLGLLFVAIPALLIALFPALRRRMFSVMLVASAAPSMFYPQLADWLLQWSAGGGNRAFALVLTTPFTVAGALLFLGGLVLYIQRRGQIRAKLEQTSRVRLRALLSWRSLVIVVLISLHGAADNTLYYFLPMFMENHFDHLPLAPAWAVSGHGLAYVITRSFLSLLPEGMAHRAILTLAGPLGGTIMISTLWFGNASSVPILYTLASLLFAAEFPVLVSEVSSRSMGQFGSIFAGGLLVSEAVTFGFLKGTGRLADLTGDYRVALSIAACGFVAFGVIAALSGLGRRSRTSP